MDASQAVSSGTAAAGLDMMDVMEELQKDDIARLASAEVRTIPLWCYVVCICIIVIFSSVFELISSYEHFSPKP